jgi:hypothetical protein
VRKLTLRECNPRWGVDAEPESTADKWVEFDCPEGHENCVYAIPFTPARDGTPLEDPNAGTRWVRTGDTFETLTLSPSIRGVPAFDTRDAAIASGIPAEYVHPRMHCHAHFFVGGSTGQCPGAITFEPDSR